MKPNFFESTLLFIVRYLGIPITILVTIIPFYYFLSDAQPDVFFGYIPKELLAFLVASTCMTTTLLIFELIAPYENTGNTNAFQVKIDIIYAASTAVVFGFLHSYIIQVPFLFKSLFASWTDISIPVVIQFIFGLAFLDFVLYWWHRSLHESGNTFLWLIHEPHHTPRRYNFLAGARIHLLDLMSALVALAMLRLFFGVSPNIIMWLLIMPVITGAVHHTNVDFRLGIFNWIFPGPEMHRIHHEQDLKEALNYSTCFPIWDIVFGTAKPFRYSNETPYGLLYQDDENETYFQAFMKPFKQMFGKLPEEMN